MADPYIPVTTWSMTNYRICAECACLVPVHLLEIHRRDHERIREIEMRLGVMSRKVNVGF